LARQRKRLNRGAPPRFGPHLEAIVRVVDPDRVCTLGPEEVSDDGVSPGAKRQKRVTLARDHDLRDLHHECAVVAGARDVSRLHDLHRERVADRIRRPGESYNQIRLVAVVTSEAVDLRGELEHRIFGRTRDRRVDREDGARLRRLGRFLKLSTRTRVLCQR
jgi:hypothetical protein